MTTMLSTESETLTALAGWEDSSTVADSSLSRPSVIHRHHGSVVIVGMTGA